MLEKIDCIFCKIDQARPIRRVDGYDIVRCKNCGFVYVNPRPPEKMLKAIYSDNYYSSDNCRLGYDVYVEDKECLTKTFRRKMDTLLRIRKGAKGRILDVGAAAGFFLKIAKEDGWDCSGVEINDKAAAYARENLGLDVRTGILEEAGFPSEHFDVVTLWDVLEHLHHPMESLKEINRILKKGGLLVVHTPNVESVVVKTFGVKMGTFRPLEHLFYFSPITLKKALAAANFRMEHLFYFQGGRICSVEFLLKRLKAYLKKERLMGGLLKFAEKRGLSKLNFYVDPGNVLVAYAYKN